MQTLHFGGSLGHQKGVGSTRWLLILFDYYEKETVSIFCLLNSVYSKLLTAKTHFETIRIVQFPLLCCEHVEFWIS